MKKTIIIPCYNEKNSINEIVSKVNKNIEDQDEIIIVDDNSNDGTKLILNEIEKNFKNCKVFYHKKNLGKGAALRTALKENLKDIVIIQDADLEYDPSDYKVLMLPFIEADADIVYGSRFLGGSRYVRIHFFWHYLANKILTFISNAFSNLNLTDMETGYKAFKSSVIKSVDLRENSFSIEPEITIKLAKKKFKFYEVSISYNGRSYEEGKKITFKDAIFALIAIIKYGVLSK